MRFKIIKSSFDGICGGVTAYENIDEVLREISYHKGWQSKEELHKAIKRWAKSADPGSVMCTAVSAIIAIGVTKSERDAEMCRYCEQEGCVEYSDFDPVEDGDIEQKATCTNCGKQWIDVFTLSNQRELAS